MLGSQKSSPPTLVGFLFDSGQRWPAPTCPRTTAEVQRLFQICPRHAQLSLVRTENAQAQFQAPPRPKQSSLLSGQSRKWGQVVNTINVEPFAYHNRYRRERLDNAKPIGWTCCLALSPVARLAALHCPDARLEPAGPCLLYDIEAARRDWSTRELEGQVASLSYERLIKDFGLSFNMNSVQQFTQRPSNDLEAIRQASFKMTANRPESIGHRTATYDIAYWD